MVPCLIIVVWLYVINEIEVLIAVYYLAILDYQIDSSSVIGVTSEFSLRASALSLTELFSGTGQTDCCDAMILSNSGLNDA